MQRGPGGVEIIIFVISAQWRAFSTQFCLILVQEWLTHSRGGGLFQGGLIGGFTVCMYVDGSGDGKGHSIDLQHAESDPLHTEAFSF